MIDKNIEEEEMEYSVVMDVEIDEFDQDDIKVFNKRLKKIEKFIEQNGITAKNFKLKKRKAVIETKELLKKLDLLISSGSYIKTESYAEMLEDEYRIRSGVLKSILAGLDVDEKIIVLRDALRELEGVTDPVDHYVQ